VNQTANAATYKNNPPILSTLAPSRLLAVEDNVRMRTGGQMTDCYDEVFAQDGTCREHAEPLVAELERLGSERLVAAGQLRDALFMRQGITFDLTTTQGAVADRPFPLDLVPRIIPAGEWTEIKRGLAQRIRALNHFVADVYHEREIVKAKVIPWTLIASRSHFARAAHGSARRAASTPTSPAATSCATPTAAGRCSRTTSAPPPGSPTCSRTGSR
jgi:hypothetical protein